MIDNDIFLSDPVKNKVEKVGIISWIYIKINFTRYITIDCINNK